MFKGLAFQFSVGAFVIICVVFSVYGFIDYRTTSSNLKSQLEQDIELAVTNMTTNLDLGESLYSFNQGNIETALKSAVISEEIAALAVTDMNGIVVAAFRSTAEGVERFGSMENEAGFTDYPVYIDNIGSQEQVGILKLKRYTGHIDEQLSQIVVETIIQSILISVVLVLTIIILMRFLVSRPINDVVIALKDISLGEGDLTKRLPENKVGEVGELATYFNQFVERIRKMVQEVSGSTQELSGAVTTLKRIVDSNSSRVGKQEKETDQVAQSIQTLSKSAGEVANNAERAAESATEADNQANTAKQVVHKTVNSVQNLADEFTKGTESINSVQSSVDEISSVLDVIRGIAEQTNLLALNAAIEAARAGEQGRGFAVVADEVRALAGRTQQSTGEIQSMIERLQSGAGDAVAVMQNGSKASNKAVSMANEALGNIGAIVDHVSSVTEMNQHIASAVNEQNDVSNAVSNNVNRIANLAHETSEVSQEALQISETVSTSSRRLEKLVESFKIDS